MAAASTEAGQGEGSAGSDSGSSVCLAAVAPLDDAGVRAITADIAAAQYDKSCWTHLAHVVFAVGRLYGTAQASPGREGGEKECEDEEAELLAEFEAQIRALNDFHGTPNTDQSGYHHSITVFFLAAIRAFLRQLPEDYSLSQACNAALASPLAEKKFLLQYYTPALLFGVDARRGWIPPDLKPMDFSDAFAVAAQEEGSGDAA